MKSLMNSVQMILGEGLEMGDCVTRVGYSNERNRKKREV